MRIRLTLGLSVLLAFLLLGLPVPVRAAWLHDIDPYAIKLVEDGPLRWYALSYLLGFFVGYVLIRRVTRVGISTLEASRVGDFVAIVALGVVVGGRLGYVLLYQPSLMWTFFERIPFWGLLAVNQGGMASHGGIAGGFLACLYYARRHRHSPLFLIDLVGFGTPLGLFFGRIANFVNGELYGRACDPEYAFAVKFPQELTERSIWPVDRLHDVYPGLPDPWKLLSAIQRGDAKVIAAIEPHLIPRHPSQLYQALLEGMFLFLILLWIWRRPRKAGTIFASFFIGYGLLRVVGELFRMPDAQIGFQLFDLTRGQWLSVPVVATGVGLLIWIGIGQGPAVGSWRVSRGA